MKRELIRLGDLFKMMPTGKVQKISIWVEGDTVHSESGFVGQKQRKTSDTIKAGKNIGKANETSRHEQAVAEAKSKHQKYSDKGYVGTQSDARNGTVSDSVGGGLFPMLAHSWEDHDKKIAFPCYVEPKLDGLRAIYKDGMFYSRNRKPFKAAIHLVKAIKEAGLEKEIFDGEIYCHDLKDSFEEIISAMKRETVGPLTKLAQYWIYDMPKKNVPMSLRQKRLVEISLALDPKLPIKVLSRKRIDVPSDVTKYHDKFVAEGYEGAMVRNRDAYYAFDKRSYDLQKVKLFTESEFRIVGMIEGSGQLQGHVGAFIAEIVDGDGKRTFQVKLSGVKITPFLKECFTKEKLWKNKWMTIKYQGFTNKNKVPRFPVGIKFRENE